MPENPSLIPQPLSAPFLRIVLLPALWEPRAHPCDPLRSAFERMLSSLFPACPESWRLHPPSVCPTHSHSRWKSEHPGQEAHVSPYPNSRGLGPGRLGSRRFTIPLHLFFTPSQDWTPCHSSPQSLFVKLKAGSLECTWGPDSWDAHIGELL